MDDCNRVANSINWGCLLGQIVFHVSGYLDMVKCGVVSMGQHIDVCIPTGNFGNFMAAYYAKVLLLHMTVNFVKVQIFAGH